jgi:hypothetical protein
MNTSGELGERLELSAALMAAHVDQLRREISAPDRPVADLEDQLAEAIWLMIKLAVVELAVARAETHGRLRG